jgi:hypothetical protein
MRVLILLTAVLFLFMIGCSEDSKDSMSADTGKYTLQLSFNGAEPLANGYLYEGWAIVNGSPVSTGKFNLNSSGAIVDQSGNAIANGEFTVSQDLSTSSAIVITIEPSGDMDTNPADTHVLAGDVASNSAILTAGHGAALGDDYSTAAGEYILATPTNGASTNENSGIWFLNLAGGSPAVGLTLPTLPTGWKYEGWTVINGTPVTTGTFTDVMVVDDADTYSSTLPGPPFPGEDFLVNAPTGLTFPTDIAGGTAVISIEPSPDDAATPYTLKPLVGMIPSNAVDHTTYMMSLNLASFPTGSATIK